MVILYGFVTIAIKQNLRDKLRKRKGTKSYSQFISELLVFSMDDLEQQLRDDKFFQLCNDVTLTNSEKNSPETRSSKD